MRRIDITSVRDSLNGYQKGKCFFSFLDISIIQGSPDICHVDHFLPHINKKVHAENMEKYVEAVQSQYEAFTYIEQDSPNDLVQKLQYLIPAYERIIAS